MIYKNQFNLSLCLLFKVENKRPTVEEEKEKSSKFAQISEEEKIVTLITKIKNVSIAVIFSLPLLISCILAGNQTISFRFFHESSLSVEIIKKNIHLKIT